MLGSPGWLVSHEWGVSLRRKNAIFTEPLLVADVEYRTWTDDWKLRHASFQGIRERVDDATVSELA